jgi:hypothetical protein
MLPPETTKASYVLLSAHRQRPIVTVIPYCDTSQCAFPTPEDLFIKLHRLPNKAFSNKNRTIRSAKCLCVHIMASFGCLSAPCWMVFTWTCSRLQHPLRRVLPGATSISFCSSVILPGHAGEPTIGHVKNEQQFSRIMLAKHGEGSWDGPLKVPSYPNPVSPSPRTSARKCFEPSLAGSALGIPASPISKAFSPLLSKSSCHQIPRMIRH